MSGAVGSVCATFLSNGGHAGVPNQSTRGPWLDGNHGNNGTWASFGKTTDFRNMSSSMAFLTVDEDPNSINDGALGTVANPANPAFVDFPAALHAGSCGFSFCDGHAELHAWKGPMIQHFTGGKQFPSPTPPNNANWQDFMWLALHSSTHN